MAEIGGGGSVPDDQRCRRTDGRGWRCRLQVAEGKGYCETHLKQSVLRQKNQPVPDSLKLGRARRTAVPKPEVDSDSDTDTDDDVAKYEIVHRSKRKTKEASKGVHVPRKRAKIVQKDDSGDEASDQPESGRSVVLDLKMGVMEIAPANRSSSSLQKARSPANPPSSSLHKAGSPVIKVGVHASSGFRRPIRSKTSEPSPIATKKKLPNIRENIEASASKKKIIKKCHWCRLTSFCVLVTCLTCKEHFFCEECIIKRSYSKKTVRELCPVCYGECSCKACTRGKPKQVKAEDPVTPDLEENVIACDPIKEMTVYNRKKKFDFDKSQQLHMICELLPVMSQMNQEKITEFDTEAENKGISHAELQVQLARYHHKKECSLCMAYIPDAHRSCDSCSFILCIACCHGIRDGCFNSNLENLKKLKMISKSSRNTSLNVSLDGSIKCPPKHHGGCEEGFLQLTSFNAFNLTKDLEESAKLIVSTLKFKRPNGLFNSSPCLLCDERDEVGLYFCTKQEFKDKNLEHFMKHWGKGQPVVIRGVFQSRPVLNWDFGFMLREYLEKSFESRNATGNQSPNSYGDWCKIEFGRTQIFSGGVTHENVWEEFLKFQLRFSSCFLEDHFPEHYNAVIESIPIKEYMNQFAGFINLGAYAPYQSKNISFGSYVSISYGGLDNPMNADLLSNLRFHAYDVVDVLVHATDRPISERVLNEVKMVMVKYNSQGHLNSSRKIANRNKLEGLLASSAGLDGTCHSDVDTKNPEAALLSDESESVDEDSAEVVNSCGAHWDVFRREDVSILLKYLTKYSDKLNRSHGSPKKVVHPLFDEVFYLDEDHKTRLEKEFNVKALSFKQDVGEAVIIPAGCPYQIKKIKSCVNVVHEFMSPESAMEGIKVNDEVRLLPVNHKAKRNMVPVKKMVIDRMQAVIEEIREVFVSQTE